MAANTTIESSSHDDDEKYWYQSKLPNRDLFDDTSGREDFLNATRELESLNKTRLDLIDENTSVLDVQNPRFQSSAESADFGFTQRGSSALESSVRSARYNYSRRLAAQPSIQKSYADSKAGENPISQSFDGRRTSYAHDSIKKHIISELLPDTKHVQSTHLPSSFYNPCEFDADHLDYKQIVIDLMLNRPTDLTFAKTKAQKEMLIKTAIRTADGNAIYPILIYLRSTISNDKFYKLLKGNSWLRGREAQVARDHYIRYLRNFEDSKVVTRELQNMGLCEEAIKCHLNQFNRSFRRGMDRLLASESTSAEYMVKYIGENYKSLLSFLGTLKDVPCGKIITQQMFFLDVKKRLFHDLGSVKASNSLFKQLAQSESPLDIIKFVTKNPSFAKEHIADRFGLPDQQCIYAILECLAEENKWSAFDQYVAEQSIGKRPAKGGGPFIPWDVVAEIAMAAPKEHLTNYLRNISDPELKFECADRHQCYELAVDTLAVELKDRDRLDTYRATVPRDSPAYMRAIHYLSNMPATSQDSANGSLTTSAKMAGAEMASGINAVWKKERSRMKDFFHRKQ